MLITLLHICSYSSVLPPEHHPKFENCLDCHITDVDRLLFLQEFSNIYDSCLLGLLEDSKGCGDVIVIYVFIGRSKHLFHYSYFFSIARFPHYLIPSVLPVISDVAWKVSKMGRILWKHVLKSCTPIKQFVDLLILVVQVLQLYVTSGLVFAFCHLITLGMVSSRHFILRYQTIYFIH